MHRDVRDEEAAAGEALETVEERRADEQDRVGFGTVHHLPLQLQPLRTEFFVSGGFNHSGTSLKVNLHANEENFRELIITRKNYFYAL